ncbi:MAG: hypothetical protein BEN19_05705 [Epulopiscium sp. Nuni2H_MBin003]|nr:MAG: hypothetical protein BEN19_05705 [Epulopiscium sp. Nuni2H_MBin003]
MQKKRSSVNTSEIIVTAIKANIMAYLLTAIFIILGSILLTYTSLGASVEKWVVLIGIMASAALCGYDMAKIENKRGYKWGSIGGIFYLIIFIIISLFTTGAGNLDMGYLITVALMVLVCSGFAGIVSVNKAE